LLSGILQLITTHLAYFREEYPLPPEHVHCMLEAVTGKHFWNFREKLAENR
jgi:hypothetical protein